MAFEKRVQKLCDRILACQTERELTITLTPQLRTPLHDRIEELRGTVLVLPLVDRTACEVAS